MHIKGVAHAFAAGDAAWAMMDDRHASVMSCQHGRPMGRFAGHNVVCDLFGEPMLPLRIPWYVTVLDLGAWGAVYTEGWDRHLITKGEAAKKTKAEPNNEVMTFIHSMAVTRAMRFHARKFSRPILRSCHTAPPDMPWNSGMMTTNLTSPLAEARSSAGRTTSR